VSPQTRLHSHVYRIKREFDGDGAVAGNLLQDCFRAGNQVGSSKDLIDEPDAIRLLCADDLPGKNEL
jgi:hypothetical protein